MAMQYMTLGTQEMLREQIVLLALERACLQAPLPRNDAEFTARKEEGRARLSLLAQEIARLAGTILAEYAGLPRKLLQAKPFGTAYADMEAQLGRLMGKQFIIDTPYAQLVHFPRYLKGIAMRVDKLKGDPGRDTQRTQEMMPLLQQWQRAEKQLRTQGKGGADARLDEFRWMLEELRIALFAQELRTPVRCRSSACRRFGRQCSAESLSCQANRTRKAQGCVTNCERLVHDQFGGHRGAGPKR